MRTPRQHWRLSRAISGTVFGFVVVVAGMGASKGGRGDEPSGNQKATHCPSSQAGFSICFPHPSAGLPNTARCTDSHAPRDLDLCVAQVCGGVASEPASGFFAGCCAQGEAGNYEQWCVERLADYCPTLSDYCSTQCPSLNVLRSDMSLDPPSAECLAGYPEAVRDTCDQDPFCCEQGWDQLCSNELAATELAAD